jgi:8-oxo-dGTP pyrophosphatase MutT (NUDIX family)
VPHVNEKGIDLVVSAFIVHPTEKAVCLVKHKKLGVWLGPGGHVGDTNPYETPDEALCKEVKEETGLFLGVTADVIQDDSYRRRMRVWDGFDNTNNPHNSAQMYVPWAVDLHDFPPLPGHRHLGLVYLIGSRTPVLSLEEKAHDAIRWFSHHDVEMEETVAMIAPIRFYAHQAIIEVHGL